MAKYKVVYKNAQIMVKSRLDKRETVNMQDMQLFQTKLIRGLMRPVIEGERKITYNAPIGITLQKFLKGGISKNDFFLVFTQILEVIKKVMNNNFSMGNLLLDLNYVFINELTKEVQFIYQPIIGILSTQSIFDFLYTVLYETNFAQEQDLSEISELISEMRKMQYFSVEEIENQVAWIYPEVYKHVKRQRNGQSQTLNDKQWGDTATGGTGDGWHTASTSTIEATALLGEEEEEQTALLNEADTSDLLDVEGTVLLVNEPVVHAFMIRMMNGERFEINRPVFRIGKERSYVDYFVANNNAVSRLHADVITRGGNFYIKDNNSTNRTFLNGAMIPVNIEMQIFDGDKIVLANEAFEFHIEKE